MDVETTPFSLTISKGGAVLLESNRVPTGESGSRGSGTSRDLSFVHATASGDTITLDCGSGCALNVVLSSDEAAEMTVTDPQSDALSVSFLDRGERYYGVWEQPFSSGLDNRGIEAPYGPAQRRSLTYGANARAPFYLTDRGYGVAVDTDALGRFSFGINGATGFSFQESTLHFTVLAADQPKRLLQLFLLRRAAPRMPPLWAFGSWWWRDDLQSKGRDAAATLRDDARMLEKLGIRATGFFVDRPYGSGKLGWGNFDFSRSFGNARALFSSLQRKGYRFLIWVANRASGDAYSAAKRGGFLFFDNRPESAWPALDLRTPKGAQWFVRHLQKLILPGVAGAKIDRGDEGELPAALVNQFAELVPSLVASAFQQRRGDDWFLISRNVHDDGRAATAVWGGDAVASFDGMRHSLVAGLRSGLVLQPMWGSDIGGYRGAPSAELFTRWLALGAVSPLMEVLIEHDGKTLWNGYPKEVRDAAKRFSDLHHDLVPYFRSEMWRAVRTGVPVMRPLFVEFPEDPAAVPIDDEFMLGDSLLVAPVLTAGARERIVYLPAGAWCSYPACETKLIGPATIRLPAPLTAIPIFVREGTAVMHGDVLQANAETAGWQPRTELAVFPPAGGTVTHSLPQDNGDAEVTIAATAETVTVTLPPLNPRPTVRLIGDSRALNVLE